MDIRRSLKNVNAVAPIRICDIGGWTDTWFAEHGAVLNIGVYPGVEVQIKISEKKREPRITLDLANFAEHYSFNSGNVPANKYPLIEATIETMKLPEQGAYEITIFSHVPPGASTGTSAAVTVALIGALDTFTPGQLTAYEIASLAHSIETDTLGLQSGIQDQICSAYGGINFIQIYQYPFVTVSQIHLPNSLWWELENRLLLVYLGAPHRSSDIHQKVISSLGERASKDPRIEELRLLANKAKDAIYAGDFLLLGKIMTQNTRVQKDLHPSLVGRSFEMIMEIGKPFHMLGAKVNGAGGEGGSITLLTDGDSRKKRMLKEALQEHGFQCLPIFLSRDGLRVWR